MAFPFKTGGDFYNCEAQRMRLHNLGANPTETATGLMYFNTGTSNLGKHAVVHDGTNFKALAFVDEIATNTAFTELAERVLTIEKALGEDTANVIDTWEEIQNFLKDINANDANLMTMLNSKVDKVSGKGLSTNDFTDTLLNKLKGIAAGAQVNVQSDWNATDGDALILNKPTIATFMGASAIGNTSSYIYWDGAKWATKALGSLAFKNSLVASDIPNLNWSKITSGKPTTLQGYGITDAYTKTKADELYANYLPLSGGRINSASWLPLEIESGDGNAAAITVNPKGSSGLQIGFSTTQGAFLYNCQNQKQIGIHPDGYAYFGTASNMKTLLHSGNIGSQNAGSADVLAYSYENQSINFGQEGKVRMIFGTAANATSLGYPKTYTSGLSVVTSYTGWQMVTYGGHDTPNPFFRKLVGDGTWFDWKQLAFLDDNVASATKLKTARTIWGQSFDGSGNVSGSIKHTNGWSFIDPSDGYVIFGYDYAQNNKPTYIDGKEIYLRYGISHTTGLTLNSSGNVLIGTQNEIKSGAKLQVKGDLYVDGNIIATKEVSAGGAGTEGESGSGGAEVLAETLASGGKTYTITNTIARTDIAVSLYEWNGTGNSWDMCLADISVKADVITVTFGSTTTVNHKLVAIG